MGIVSRSAFFRKHKKGKSMKVPEPRRLPSGNYSIQLRLGGRSYTFTDENKKECKTKATLFKARYISGAKEDVSRLTLSEAMDMYIASRSNVLSPNTIRGYRIIQRNRFQSVMDKSIAGIRNWQMIVNEEALVCSPKTLRNAWGLVSSVLKANRIDPGSVTLPQIVPREHEFLEPEQVLELVRYLEGDKYELAILLGLHGLRRSEVMALRKSDIANGVIRVSGAFALNESNKWEYKETNKNDTSRRDVPVLIDRVNDLAKASPSKGYLIRQSAESVSRRVDSLCEELGFPNVGFHGLRHSFASLAYYVGLSELETMRLGGWKDPAVMRKIYTHLAARKKDEAKDKLKGFFEAGLHN